MIKISVIVPFYKVSEADFRRCVDSLKAQTLDGVEFIFVDDRGPDDEPRRLLAESAANDSRFKLLAQERNGGVSAARNRGLDAASGYYVAFVDADDSVAPDFLEKLYLASGSGAADMVFSNIELTNDSGSIIGRFGEFCDLTVRELSDGGLARLCRHMPWTVIGKLFRTAAALRFDPAMFFGEDKDFTARSLPGVRRYAAISAAPYSYRTGSVHSAMRKSVFSASTVEQIFRFCATLKRSARRLPEDWRLARAAFGRELFDASLVRFAVNRKNLSPEVCRLWLEHIGEFWMDVTVADRFFPPFLTALLALTARRPRLLQVFFPPLFLAFRLWWKFRLEARLAEKLSA